METAEKSRPQIAVLEMKTSQLMTYQVSARTSGVVECCQAFGRYSGALHVYQKNL